MAGQAESWVLPKMDWVFQRCGFQPPIPENLLEQLDLGFAFTAPLNIKVIKDNGKAPSSGTGASDGVLGAPAGHAAIEKGCPPGQAVPAAAPAVNPGADAGPAAAPDAAFVPPAAAGKSWERSVSKACGCENEGKGESSQRFWFCSCVCCEKTPYLHSIRCGCWVCKVLPQQGGWVHNMPSQSRPCRVL